MTARSRRSAGRAVAGRAVAGRAVAGRVGAVALGWATTRTARAVLVARPPGGAARWERVNHRGGTVTLLPGPAAAAGLAAAVAVLPGVAPRRRAAAALAALGAGAFGVLDDLAERGSSKGLRGHLGALRRGELTTGAVKLLGIGAVGVASAALAGGSSPSGRVARAGRSGRAADVLVGGALVAGTANLLNLFDLRPGRALKVGLLVGLPAVPVAGAAGTLAAASVGASSALLPEDLGETGMLGDGGANALGAVLGVVLLAGGRRTRYLALGVVGGLTLASEKVSFTKVIAATPVLRELDALGRRPAPR